MAKPIVKEILSWVITIVVAVVLALLIKRYVFCIANVPTGYMDRPRTDMRMKKVTLVED